MEPPTTTETSITDALIAQALIDSGERQLDRDADVVADAGRRRAGAAAEAVDGDDVRTRCGQCRWRLAATLCTAAILTMTGFLYSVASFSE